MGHGNEMRLEPLKAIAVTSVQPVKTSYSTTPSFGNLSRTNSNTNVLPSMLSNSSSGNTSQHNQKMSLSNSNGGKNYTAEQELKHQTGREIAAAAMIATERKKLERSPGIDELQIATAPQPKEKKEGILSKMFKKTDKNPMGKLPDEETMIAALNAARLENPNLDGILKDIEKATA